MSPSSTKLFHAPKANDPDNRSKEIWELQFESTCGHLRPLLFDPRVRLRTEGNKAIVWLDPELPEIVRASLKQQIEAALNKDAKFGIPEAWDNRPAVEYNPESDPNDTARFRDRTPLITDNSDSTQLSGRTRRRIASTIQGQPSPEPDNFTEYGC